MIIIITGFLFSFGLNAQKVDTIVRRQSSINLLLGTKLFNTQASPEIRIASIIGVELAPKRKNVNISYRNFFSIQPTPIDTILYKNIESLISTNSLNLVYTFNINSSLLKLGLGPYQERRQSSLDQQFIVLPPHFYGVDFSLYTKLKWINVGYRHQIELYGYGIRRTNILDIFRYSLCIEIPIKLK